jgi:hypothetical protein
LQLLRLGQAPNVTVALCLGRGRLQRSYLEVILMMSRSLRFFVLALLVAFLVAAGGPLRVSGEDKEAAGPAGLLGSWQLVKYKARDGQWQ